MTVKQLSVFLENKRGRVNDLTRILADNNINMRAFSTSENAEFGIMRLVVSDVEKAVTVLKEHNFAVNVTEVICLNCSNSVGSMSKILDKLASHNVFIEYMYAFSEGETASVIIRPTDIATCIKVLEGLR